MKNKTPSQKKIGRFNVAYFAINEDRLVYKVYLAVDGYVEYFGRYSTPINNDLLIAPISIQDAEDLVADIPAPLFIRDSVCQPVKICSVRNGRIGGLRTVRDEMEELHLHNGNIVKYDFTATIVSVYAYDPEQEVTMTLLAAYKKADQIVMASLSGILPPFSYEGTVTYTYRNGDVVGKRISGCIPNFAGSIHIPSKYS